VLEWAAGENRVLLTHDVATMSRYAHDRVAAGLSMPGVFEIPANLAVGLAIVELVLIFEASVDGEWEGAGPYLPAPLTGPSRPRHFAAADHAQRGN